MTTPPNKRKQFLFVDDDTGFLNGIRQVFSEMARGSWEIFTAENHAQALGVLRQQPVDVVVLDLDMPVMDGLQFLRLLGRTHPGQQVVILTGRANEESRKACLESGAALFLEKLITPDGFSAVFSALDELAAALPQEGFRGMMRRVGLQEVLQMECLGRKSSVLEVFTENARGRIFIEEGSIVHAEAGALQGEVALYALLGLRGGEFNLQPFSEPAQRSISGHYEFLLMEAARLSDEGTTFLSSAAATGRQETGPLEALAAATVPQAPPLETERVRIEEVVLCSGAGEILHEYGCQGLERRVALLRQIEEQGEKLSALLRGGRFERLEMVTSEGRLICQVQPHMRLFVRSAREAVNT